MKLSGRLASTLLCGAMAISVAGCGTDKEQVEAKSTTSAAQKLLDAAEKKLLDGGTGGFALNMGFAFEIEGRFDLGARTSDFTKSVPGDNGISRFRTVMFDDAAYANVRMDEKPQPCWFQETIQAVGSVRIPATFGLDGGGYGTLNFSVEDVLGAAKKVDLDLLEGVEGDPQAMEEEMSKLEVDITFGEFGKPFSVARPPKDLQIEFDPAGPVIGTDKCPTND